MRQTPGQLLAAELKRRKLKKSEFARQIGKTYQTVNNWTKDEGFLAPQRAEAARGLGLPPDYFDRPDLAEQRESYRREVIEDFRRDAMTPPLTDEEWRSVESVRFPQDKLPTLAFYEGFVHLMRGNITATQFRQNVGPNEEADRMNREDALAKTSNDQTRARKKKPVGVHRRTAKTIAIVSAKRPL